MFRASFVLGKEATSCLSKRRFPAVLPAKRVWNTCLGLTGEALLVACAALAPLVSPQAFRIGGRLWRGFFRRRRHRRRPPRNAARARPARPSVERLQPVEGRLFAPAAIPSKVAAIVDEPLSASGYGVPGGVDSGERIANIFNEMCGLHCRRRPLSKGACSGREPALPWRPSRSRWAAKYRWPGSSIEWSLGIRHWRGRCAFRAWSS